MVQRPLILAMSRNDANEVARLEALNRYCILDTRPEDSFDRIARVAKTLFKASAAFISFIDDERQWFKSRHGIEPVQVPRERSFCNIVMDQNGPVVVPDTDEDPRFPENPLGPDSPAIRFYAAAPLRTPDGFNIGTLCVMHWQPCPSSDEQVRMLGDLAAMVIDELELRKSARTDLLTGVMTFETFGERFEIELHRKRRYGSDLSIALFDPDGLADFNTVHGYAVGDRALQQIAETCRRSLRAIDLLGRVEAARFIVALPHTAQDGAVSASERIRRQIEKITVPSGEARVGLTTSVGVTRVCDRDDLERALRRAEEALHEAKQTGRNRTEFFQEFLARARA